MIEMTEKRSRNCKVCGGLLSISGRCTKCEQVAERNRIKAQLDRCQRELKAAKEDKRIHKYKIVIRESYIYNLTKSEAFEKAKALLNAGLWYFELTESKD